MLAHDADEVNGDAESRAERGHDDSKSQFIEFASRNEVAVDKVAYGLMAGDGLFVELDGDCAVADEIKYQCANEA